MLTYYQKSRKKLIAASEKYISARLHSLNGDF